MLAVRLDAFGSMAQLVTQLVVTASGSGGPQGGGSVPEFELEHFAAGIHG